MILLRDVPVSQRFASLFVLVLILRFCSRSQVDKETRLAGGITDGLIRFSVGLEDESDLRRDLEQALAKIGTSDGA